MSKVELTAERLRESHETRSARRLNFKVCGARLHTLRRKAAGRFRIPRPAATGGILESRRMGFQEIETCGSVVPFQAIEDLGEFDKRL